MISFLPGAEVEIEYGKTTATPCSVVTIDDSPSGSGSMYTQVEDHPLVTWATLARFPYDVPGKDEENNPDLRKKDKYPIPETVKKLNGVSVAVVGFMIPVDLDADGGKAASFMLIRSQMTCCFGIAPRMNEWVFVQMEEGKTADAVMDVPVTVFGVLSVGEKHSSKWSLYRLVSNKVAFLKQSSWQ